MRRVRNEGLFSTPIQQSLLCGNFTQQLPDVRLVGSNERGGCVSGRKLAALIPREIVAGQPSPLFRATVKFEVLVESLF
jgi:hypothetical protein